VPPELLISRRDAPDWQPISLVVEIATIAVVATIAAYLLGLSGLDMLLAVFFSTTLAGQFLTAFLNRMRPHR
jgi:hypothetical protein